MTVEAGEALRRLKEGNERFVAGLRSLEAMASPERRAELAAAQNPFAIVLGCSDSRVPAEVVFDQGLGDLFVIRVAGNIVAPSQVGSVEFAASKFDAQLVVILGHTQCGAIAATLEAVRNPTRHSANLRSIVDRIRPSIETLIAAGIGDDEERLVRQAVRANVRASADHLRHGSPLLEQMIHDGKLMVVGAEYSLETGVVDFFDGAAIGPATG
jgi:carbonic anhydrase